MPVEMVCNVVIRINMYRNVCLNGIYSAIARLRRYVKMVIILYLVYVGMFDGICSCC